MINTNELKAQVAALWDAFTPLERRILHFTLEPITEGRLRNRISPAVEAELWSAVVELVVSGNLERRESFHRTNGAHVVDYHNPKGAEIVAQTPRATWISGMREGDLLHFHVGQPCEALIDTICTALDYAQSLGLMYSYQLNGSKLTLVRLA